MVIIVTAKKCDNCNAPTEENAVFCSECGHELSFTEPNSYAEQVVGSGAHNQPSTKYESAPTQRTYEQQDKYGKQQGKNYRRKRLMSRMISRIISFFILMAIFYAISFLF